MKKYLLLVLISALYLSGCKKDKATAPPAISTGSISGIISPAGASTSVNASQMLNGKMTTYKATPDRNGSFKFTGLPAGDYTLNFTVTAGYTTPVSQTKVVIGGNNTDAGTIIIEQKPGNIIGSISPAGAAAQLRITNTPGGKTIDISITPDAATGNFKFTDVPPGIYTLSATATPGFAAPSAKTLTVTAGQSTNAETLTFQASTFTGSISGIVSPAGQVLNVTVTTGVNPQFTVVPNADGTFKITGVPAGKYHLTVTPISGSTLYPYTNLGVLVEAQDTNIGTASLRTSAQGYVPFCTVDGYKFAAFGLVSHYTGSTLTFAGPITLYMGSYTFAVSLSNVNGVGEYSCNSATASSMTLSNGLGSWSSRNPGGSAVIKITAFDPVTHHYSGTFSGVLTSGTDPSNAKTIANGNLDGYQYQTP